jgi:hypothetical protein
VSSADFLAPHPSFSFPGFSNLPDNENETIPAKQFETPQRDRAERAKRGRSDRFNANS